jgi:hypothetical protein
VVDSEFVKFPAIWISGSLSGSYGGDRRGS